MTKYKIVERGYGKSKYYVVIPADRNTQSKTWDSRNEAKKEALKKTRK